MGTCPLTWRATRAVVFGVACIGAREAAGQQAHELHQAAAVQHAHADGSLFEPREASGTAWLPENTPMYGVHKEVGGWQVMLSENAFAQYLRDGGDRGVEQGGSINWFMAMARRRVGAARLGLRGMISLEPATIPGCGYPDLLASGEVCDGEVIHDRQHPHDLFMELAAEYDRPIGHGLRWQLYGGPAGEPALGPVAYPHRISAMPNPLAPIGHHWLDATHITFGVVTSGIYTTRWKAEASVFNGREPDEERTGVDVAVLDSFSGRLWFAPASTLMLQVSAGRLNEVEEPNELGIRPDLTRVTASAAYHRSLRQDGMWATTLAWGMNSEEGESSHAMLAETSVTFDQRNVWFGRFELSGKTAHDLDIVATDQIFSVAKLQAGYSRYFDAWYGMQPGFGGSFSVGIVPETLAFVYGRRANLGLGVFLTLRSAVMHMTSNP